MPLDATGKAMLPSCQDVKARQAALPGTIVSRRVPLCMTGESRVHEEGAPTATRVAPERAEGEERRKTVASSESRIPPSLIPTLIFPLFFAALRLCGPYL